MSELKTLKDIQNLHGFHNLKTYNKEIEPIMTNRVVDNGTEMAIFPSQLKQEAIKWVKSKNTGGFSFNIGFDGKVSKWNKTKPNLNSIDWANLGEMIGFIDFFNIEESDLK